MQEDINNRVYALSIRSSEVGARLTASMLRSAMKKFIAQRDKHKLQKSEHKVGKQSLKSLMKQNTGLSNMEITDENIGSFKRIAAKYGIDYSLKKDTTSEKPHYIVFFKARDVDVMTEAFKEYTKKSLEKDKKPSILKLLKKSIEKSKILNRNKEHVRQRSREMVR